MSLCSWLIDNVLFEGCLYFRFFLVSGLCKLLMKFLSSLPKMLLSYAFGSLPTGVVDEGEDICDAAVREVKEETGIDAKFVEILAFRQSHKAFFEKSDLFFVCLLQPLSFDIQKQESEIEAAEWMPFKEYAAQPFVQKHDLLKHIVDICLAKRDGKYSRFSPVPTTTISSDKNSYLYLNRQCLNNQ